MSSPVDAALSAPTAVAGWAKARPIVFFVFVVAVALLAIKFSDKIVGFLRKYRLTRWMVPAAAAPAAALIIFAMARAVVGG